MKITFVSAGPNLSGGQRVIAIYADQLRKLGHDVTVVARGQPILTKRAKTRHILQGKFIPRPAVSHFDNMEARLIVLPNADPITADDVPDADVVIATWWETAFEVVHFPTSKGRKFYFIQHHEVHSHLPRHLSGASYLLPLKKITISSWLVDKMRELYGDDDVALIHNSVDHDMFWAPRRCRQSPPVVGLLYSTTPFKGVDIAFRAIEIARREHPDIRVIAFGTEAPTKDLPLPSGTDFFLSPPQDRIRELYGSCDVWLCGSRAEGFHLPPGEAMACRCPVVSTRVGGPVDLIQDGREGFLVDIDDADALGARLAQVLAFEESRWQEMSQAAYDKMLSSTWADAASLLETELLKAA